MNAFRLVDGFSPALFEARTGLPGSVLDTALAGVSARGLVKRTADSWRATPQGFRFLNDILVELLPPADPAP